MAAMLFLHGFNTVEPDWYVKETVPPSYCRVYYVHSGNVVYRDDQTVRQLCAGYLYVFPSARAYEMSQDPENPLTCLFLHIDIAPHLLSGLLELPVEEGSFLHSLLNAMETWMRESPRRKIDTVMEALSDSLVAYLNSENLLQAVPRKLADTIGYITDHVGEKLTVEQLSSLSGYHTQYYIRLFCSYMGTTPHQYLINYRMKLGFSELMTGRSVTETADLVGYPEVRNFIRAFKKYYGYSPSQVKKYIRLEL